MLASYISAEKMFLPWCKPGTEKGRFGQYSEDIRFLTWHDKQRMTSLYISHRCGVYDYKQRQGDRRVCCLTAATTWERLKIICCKHTHWNERKFPSGIYEIIQ
jgi:hypothetical protein